MENMSKFLDTTIGAEFTFNTGRHYSPEGQIIKARVVKEVSKENRLLPDFREWVVQFEDLTRHIRGEVTVMTEAAITPLSIMVEYDAGRYQLV